MSRGRTSGIRTESVLVHPRTGEEILLKRSSRRTLSVELRPDASLLVRAPLGVSEAGIFSFLEGQSAWIESRRKKLLERIESMPSDSLSDEEISQALCAARRRDLWPDHDPEPEDPVGQLQREEKSEF